MSEWTTNRKTIVFIDGERFEYSDPTPAEIKKLAKDHDMRRFIVTSDPHGEEEISEGEDLSNYKSLYIFPREKAALLINS